MIGNEEVDPGKPRIRDILRSAQARGLTPLGLMKEELERRKYERDKKHNR
jgi:hypothetical protein